MSETRKNLIDALQRLARGYTDSAETVADILLGETPDDLMPMAAARQDEVLTPQQVYAPKE